ncbi:sigma-70 family RNA polymerase sigma factor [Fimbriiglobus ruber]|uniref:RNA polymerase sigma-70 region 4 domain-containing protein n=1 Tax=Fimbriiglobus ruber TaxID=1908690 RepID=A0A225CY88_9BACT|nr:sigma-70 family RNA polymerase sigma factor [Fimbriiglobus ruber]OWK34340.1 hypothetical protein FRUB_10311 [Fimbriiglobus ruber]
MQPTLFDRPLKPKIGPLARLVWDEKRGEWQPVLRESGQRILKEFIDLYPEPILVLSTAYRGTWNQIVARGDDHFEECKLAAYLGATIAATKFDPRRGVKFVTYAAAHIRAKCQRTNMRRAGEPDSLIPVDAVRDLDGGTTAGWDSLGVSSKEDGEREVWRTHLRRDIQQALLAVPIRQRRIFCHWYGLLGYDQLTLRQIGVIEGISRERVRQLCNLATERLRPLLRKLVD